MKCDEAQSLQHAYQDSELDARTTLEIEQHLSSCAECARFFGEEQRFETWVSHNLKRGVSSPSLWQGVEQAVMAAAAGKTVSPPASGEKRSDGRGSRRDTLVQGMRSLYQQAPRAWGALAAAWAIILALNLGARDSGSPRVARAVSPTVSQMRLAFKQKQSLLAQLATPAEPSRQDPGPTGPRSQLDNNNPGNVRWL